ncbi:MAG: beta-mannosidase [Kiritimatiellia bacterium]
MQRINLSGNWEFRRAHATWEAWLPARVPGCVHTDLMANGLIDDPFKGMNELDLLWIDTARWEYRRHFEVPKSFLGEICQLIVFEGLDTIARIYLNGRPIGRADNMFRRWSIEVSGQLRPGKNELRVVFTGPVTEGQRLAKLYGRLPGGTYHWGTGRVRETGRNYVRKAQYQFGWDWGPLLATCGIWRPVELIAFSGPRIEYVTHSQVHDRRCVTLHVRVYLYSPISSCGKLELEVDGASHCVAYRTRRGHQVLETSIRLFGPRLWWPAGAGDQHLYPFTIRVFDSEGNLLDQHHQQIGLRHVELVREPDKTGESFLFRINGRPIYAKGANWIPADSFPTRLRRSDYERLLGAAVQANMNMLRVWGGGIYEHDDFYSLCDRLGLMVWHDHMFACAAYPAHREFLQNVAHEVEHQVLRLAHHPCIVLWCGNNENEEGMVYWWRAEPNIARLRQDYRTLTRLCEKITRRCDPARPWWPSSPSTRGDLKDPRSLSAGDSHFWEVWHRRAPFARYLEIRPRFQSEFGFQSFPCLRTLRRVISARDLNLTSPAMEHHQRSGIGNAVIVETICRYFRLPTRLDDLCYVSQLVQALAIQMGVEHWRRIKPYCMGTLYWQLNDCWPVASWSSIDYAGCWKVLHYTARRFYAPLLLSLFDAGGTIELWATSDVHEPLRGSWHLQLRSLDGSCLKSWRGNDIIAADQSRRLARWPVNSFVSDFEQRCVRFLHVVGRWGRYSAENFFFFAPFKQFELQRPQIRITAQPCGKAIEVKVTADKVALFVELDTGALQGQWSENYFHLLPDRPRLVGFVPERAVSARELVKRLKVRTLRDTY